jgi:hypothetical protein
MKLDDLDHPFVFAIAITLTVVGMMALGSWAFTSMGWKGPARLLRGPSAI